MSACCGFRSACAAITCLTNCMVVRVAYRAQDREVDCEARHLFSICVNEELDMTGNRPGRFYILRPGGSLCMAGSK